MTEKKLFVIADADSMFVKTQILGKNNLITEATERDLRELGWVKAEPTNCVDCAKSDVGKTWVNCRLHKGSGFNKSGLYTWAVCLDFVPRSQSGKQVRDLGLKREGNKQVPDGLI